MPLFGLKDILEDLKVSPGSDALNISVSRRGSVHVSTEALRSSEHLKRQLKALAEVEERAKTAGKENTRS